MRRRSLTDPPDELTVMTTGGSPPAASGRPCPGEAVQSVGVSQLQDQGGAVDGEVTQSAGRGAPAAGRRCARAP